MNIPVLMGRPPLKCQEALRPALRRRGVFCAALLDEAAIWDPASLDRIVACFPRGLLNEADLYLVLTECLSNATLHGKATALGIVARNCHSVLLLSFWQFPPMPARIHAVLERARKGRLPDCDAAPPSGLGFPILTRLARRVTVSHDCARLQLWFRPSPDAAASDLELS